MAVTGKGFPFVERFIFVLIQKNVNVDWRTDFLVQHYGEGDLKIAGCPQLSPGFMVRNIVIPRPTLGP